LLREEQARLCREEPTRGKAQQNVRERSDWLVTREQCEVDAVSLMHCVSIDLVEEM